jgi:hypothetical protein
MSPSEIQADTVIPERWTVFGWDLQPFTIGHARLLMAMGVDGETMTDNLIAAMICSREWTVATKWIKSPWYRLLVAWRCFVIGWRKARKPDEDWLGVEALKLRDYMQHYSTAPNVLLVGEGKQSDAPLWESVMVSLMQNAGLSEADASSLPVNKALMWYYLIAEGNGLCTIVDADKYHGKADAMDAELRAKFEAVNG